MIQAPIPDELRVTIDFQTEDFSRTVKVLNPVVFKDSNTFCCLLGPDRIEGILGCGESVDAAIKDWEKNVEERITDASADDEVAQYVIDFLSISKKDVW